MDTLRAEWESLFNRMNEQFTAYRSEIMTLRADLVGRDVQVSEAESKALIQKQRGDHFEELYKVCKAQLKQVLDDRNFEADECDDDDEVIKFKPDPVITENMDSEKH